MSEHTETRWSVIRELTASRPQEFDRVIAANNNALAHYQQFLVLEAAVLAFVFPALSADGKVLIPPYHLKAALVATVLSFAVGVVLCCGTRWFMYFTGQKMVSFYRALDEAMSEADDDPDDIRTRFALAVPEAKKVIDKFSARGVAATVTLEAVMYGSLLAGILFLLRGFTAQ